MIFSYTSKRLHFTTTLMLTPYLHLQPKLMTLLKSLRMKLKKQLIVNPKKFQVMFISKERNTLPECLKLQIINTEIKPQSLVELLGVTIDNELNLISTVAGFANQQDVS